MEISANTFKIFVNCGYGLISSGQDVITHHSPNEQFYVFLYPKDGILNVRNVVGRNEDLNMPIVSSFPSKTFKVETDEELKTLLLDLCK